MDARRQKAHELADRAKLTFADGCYVVPSQSHGGSYTVILDGGNAACECPDFELHDKPCKHILAAQIWQSRQYFGIDQVADTAPALKVLRKAYAQDWPNYNAAQANERRHFMALLADLCQAIPEPAQFCRGRPPVPLADAVYSAIFKVYSTLSARRFSGDLEEAHAQGHIGRLPHYNTVLNYLDNAAVTPILYDLIERSSLPLRAVEETFAVDSSGFATSRFERWFDHKYGVTRSKAEWVKAHIAIGTKTNVITAARILDKDAADAPQFPPLMEATARGFKIAEVSADKAYCGTECFDAVDKHGGTLFAAFKSNATGAVGGTFEKMFHYFSLRRDEFLCHYHARSNVESTFSMVKRKFGDAVRSKTDTAMRNEVLAKFVAHNVCCVVAEWYALGIEPVFDSGDVCSNNQEPAQIVRFPGA